MLTPVRNFFTSSNPSAVRNRRLLSSMFFTVLVGLLLVVLPWNDISEVIHLADWRLILLAFLATSPSIFLNAATFKVITDQQGMGISNLQIMAINMIVSFYEIFIPATLFGSGLRWYRFSKYSKRPVESFTAIAYYKLVNTFLTILVSFGFILLLDAETIRGHVFQIVLIIIAIALILLFTPFLSKVILSWIKNWDIHITRYPLLLKIHQYIIKTLSSFMDFGKLKLKDQVRIIFLTLSAQAAFLVGYYLMAKSVGVDISFIKISAIRSLTLLVSSLPLNFTPAIGLNDISLVALLVAAGVDLDHAIAVSLVALTRKIIFSLIGGVIEIIQFFKNRQDVKLATAQSKFEQDPVKKQTK
jgi:uncharacterized protein (TIRG00374 family)